MVPLGGQSFRVENGLGSSRFLLQLHPRQAPGLLTRQFGADSEAEASAERLF